MTTAWCIKEPLEQLRLLRLSKRHRLELVASRVLTLPLRRRDSRPPSCGRASVPASTALRVRLPSGA